MLYGAGFGNVEAPTTGDRDKLQVAGSQNRAWGLYPYGSYVITLYSFIPQSKPYPNHFQYWGCGLRVRSRGSVAAYGL